MHSVCLWIYAPPVYFIPVARAFLDLFFAFFLLELFEANCFSMANLCFGVGIEEEGAVKIRRAEKRGTRSLSWVCDSVLIAMRLRAFVVLGSVSVGSEMRHCFLLCVCVCPVSVTVCCLVCVCLPCK
jgi:hypothetical protein